MAGDLLADVESIAGIEHKQPGRQSGRAAVQVLTHQHDVELEKIGLVRSSNTPVSSSIEQLIE